MKHSNDKTGRIVATDPSRILVVDVGGTHVKVSTVGQRKARKIRSGVGMRASTMVKEVKRLAEGLQYDVVSLGYPGPVTDGHPSHNPHNLGGGWVGFNFSKAFGCPVRIINDAALQALGNYKGGRMLFLGLGAGLGSAMIVDGVLEPMELAHLPYKRGRTFEDYVGARGLKRLGRKQWRRHVKKVVTCLKDALCADSVVVGGGNSKHLRKVPGNARLSEKKGTLAGGVSLWTHPLKDPADSFRPSPRKATRPGSTGN